MALFEHRFREGIFLLDEPEAALSPLRQLSFLTKLHQLILSKKCQFIIATHSPILLRYPGAVIYEFGEPAGIIARSEEEMDRVSAFIDQARAKLPDFHYQRNTVYLRFSHVDYPAGRANETETEPKAPKSPSNRSPGAAGNMRASAPLMTTSPLRKPSP